MPPVAPSAPPTVAALPELASGRPRRLLLALASLEQTDAAYRALDLAIHLRDTQRWAVRVLVHAEGLLLAAYHAAGLEAQRVDARPLLAATTPEAGATASLALQREVWWGHLDAVAVFDPECFWVLDAAGRRRIPTLVDCSQPPDTSSCPAVVNAQLQAVPQLADRICFSSPAVAATMGVREPATIIPTWPGRTAAGPVALGPQDGEVLQRARDLLAALQPGSAAPGPALGLNLSVDRPVIRPLLDAAAAGRPIISVSSPAVTEIFRAHEAVFLPSAEPQALAHALLDLANNPASAARRAEAARRRVLVLPARESQLVRWQALLEDAVIIRSGFMPRS